MRDRKYTKSEIKEMKLALEKSLYVLGMILIIAWFTLVNINFAVDVAIPFTMTLLMFSASGFLEKTLLKHNEKLDKYEEAQLKAEADKEKVKSQIWVNE